MPVLASDHLLDTRLKELVAEPPPEKLSLFSSRGMDVLGAAFRHNNSITSMALGHALRPDSDEPLNDYFPTKDEIEGYDPEEFVNVRNPLDVARIKNAINGQRADTETLSKTSLGSSLLANGLAGLASPTVLFPASFLGRTASLGKTALGFAGATAAAMAVDEIALQASQSERTAEESLYSLGVATVFGGVVGTGLSRAIPAMKAIELKRGLSEALTPQSTMHPVVAGASGVEPAELAAAVEAGSAVAPGLPLGLVKWTSPGLRVFDTVNPVAHSTQEALGNTPVRLAKNNEGVATGANRVIEAPIYKNTAPPDVVGAQLKPSQLRAAGYDSYVNDKGETVTLGEGHETTPVVVQSEASRSAEGVFGASKALLFKGVRETLPAFLGYRQRMAVAAGEAPMRGKLQSARIAFRDAPSGLRRMRDRRKFRFEQTDPFLRMLRGETLDGSGFREIAGRAAAVLHSDEPLIDALGREMSPTSSRLHDAETLRLIREHAPEAAKLAELFEKELYTPTLKKLIELKMLAHGLTPETASAYFKRIWSVAKLKANQYEFEKIVFRWFREGQKGSNPVLPLEAVAAMRDGELKDLARNIWRDLVRMPSGRVDYSGHHFGIAGSLEKRAFLIPNALVNDFLKHDILEGASRYWRSVWPDIALTEKFGDAEMTKSFDQIQRSYRVLHENLAEAKLAKGQSRQDLMMALNEEERSVVLNLEGQRDRLRGMRPEHDLSPAFSDVAASMRSYAQLRFGGGILLASLPTDFMMTFLVHGFRGMKSTILPILRDFKKMGIAKGQAQFASVAMDRTIAGRAASFTELGAHYSSDGSLLRELLHTGASGIHKITGLNWWNETGQTFGAHSSMMRTLDSAIRAFGKGEKLEASEIARLAHYRLDMPMLERIYKQWKKHGGEDQGWGVANAHLWDEDPHAADMLASAMKQESDDTLMMTGITDVPLAFDTSWAKTIFMFKRFAVAMTSRANIAAQRMRAGELTVAAGISGLVFGGMMVYALKKIAAGDEISTDWTTLMREGIDRSAILGAYTEILAMADKANAGPMRALELMGVEGGQTLSRYAQRNAMSSFMGPVFGMGQDTTDLLGDTMTGRFDQQYLENWRNMAPYQGVWYWRLALDKLLNEAAVGLGVPKRSKNRARN